LNSQDNPQRLGRLSSIRLLKKGLWDIGMSNACGRFRARSSPCLRLFTLLAGLLIYPSLRAESVADTSPPGDDLARLSLTDLANLDVTSVSKSSEAVKRAAASIYVITHEDIVLSGATSIPEALRLAPNLLVTQTTSSAYTITSRGLGGNPGAQNFSNKLLMLIDGRSVYTPLFSGIYADAQDVLLEDVERIEIISGPGATLWGANAMNGVINIITRAAYLTQGAYMGATAGNQDQNTRARYGGKINEDTSYRAYGLIFHRAALEQADGSSASDAWSKGQAGFRVDWSTDQRTATVQGDVYRGLENQLANDDVRIAGGNLLTRYQHHSDRSEFQVQAYFDQTERVSPTGQGAFVTHTYDVELQQAMSLGSMQRVVLGAGERVNGYGITNSTSLLFLPAQRWLTLANLFVQDTLSLTKSLNIVVGLKMEDDPYWGWTALPDARASWQITDHASLWAAASKAIRAPTPFDDEVVEKVGPTVFLAANTLFRPERVTAYEIGSRGELNSAISLSGAAFYNDYDDLRTVEPASSSVFLPLYWGNSLRGDTYGVEAWANWQVTPWWRLSPGLTVLHEQLRFKAGAVGLLGTSQAADDPSSHATLASSMEVGHHISVDATLRYVGALPNPALAHYYEFDSRLGWRVSRAVDLSLNGRYLLHARHSEFAAPAGEYLYRSVSADLQWRF
jgi:iron complex outermembrane recepter protein